MQKIWTWLKNGRCGALVQSVMPATVAALFAAGHEGFSVVMALLAVLGVACAHLAANLLDDYFDYKVDMAGSREKVVRKGFRAMMHKYPYLTDGSQTLKTTLKAILQFTAVAGSCGVVVFVFRTVWGGLWGADGSWWIPFLAGATAVLGYFYSAPPLKIAYRGLGELETGLVFGPMLMMGVYYASCGVMDWQIVFVSVPVGVLVLNILFTHSYIDMAGDAECGKMTFARLLGSQKACIAVAFVVNLLPFALVILGVCLGLLPPVYLLVLIALPRALWLCRSLHGFYRGEQGVPSAPPKWLGPMAKDWEGVRAAGLDWFLMRWMAARNTLSAFCLAIILAKIILLIF